MKENIITAIKAFVGSSMTLPGISGGTTAIILNVYDRLIQTVSKLLSPKTFWETLKKNFWFLAVFAIFAVLGLATLSQLLLFITEKFPIPMHFLFMGAILGSVPALWKKTSAKKISAKEFIAALIGLATVFIIDVIPPLSSDSVNLANGFSFSEIFTFLISGIVLAVALILPGISFSHMLMVMGIYETFYEAIASLNIGFLTIIGISLLIGIALLIKLIAWAMEKVPQIMYSGIIGFVLGSIKDLYIGLPTGWWIPISILTFAAGFALVFAMAKKED